MGKIATPWADFEYFFEEYTYLKSQFSSVIL